MTTEKHTPDWTPEPWSDSTHARTWKETGGVITSILRTMPDADYDRARLCTNALSGIDDPAAFVERAKRIEEAADRVDMQAWNILNNEYGEHFRISDSDTSRWADRVRAFLAASAELRTALTKKGPANP